MNNELNKKVLDLIYNSIMSEGGDGDAIWLSKHTPLSELQILIEEYNKEHNTGWEVKKEEHCLSWGTNQEWAFIVDSKDIFDSRPKWIVLKIDY